MGGHGGNPSRVDLARFAAFSFGAGRLSNEPKWSEVVLRPVVVVTTFTIIIFGVC